jgi:hypothetical protein
MRGRTVIHSRPSFLGGATALMVACGTSPPPPPTCQDIVNQYAAEIPNASICDPTQAGSCSSSLLPVVVSVATADGGLTFTALGNCNVAYNPARVAKLLQLVDSYQAMGCQPAQVPVCPPVTSQCDPGPLGYQCFP